jgi:DnaJ-class molecular chaperone
MIFVAEREWHGHWSCHRSDRIVVAAGGETQASAMERCCEIYRTDAAAFVVAEATSHRVLFRQGVLCPECGGKGDYVGLAVEEQCPRCEGSKYV